MPMSRGRIVVSLLVVVTCLALGGWWARRGQRDGCALDGMPIDPRYRVRIRLDSGAHSTFCCIRCAEIWLSAQKNPPEMVFVTDEISQEEIEARQAYFVRSLVVTTPTTDNRIHAFRHRLDAQHHALTSGGRVLGGNEIPFAAHQPRDQ